MIELLKCPFCGGSDFDRYDELNCWIQCETCFAEGPVAQTMDVAEQLWNRHATGCARDQRTTQFCAEVVGRDAEIKRLREIIDTVSACIASPDQDLEGAFNLCRAALNSETKEAVK